MEQRIQTINPSKELESVIMDLEKIKYSITDLFKSQSITPYLETAKDIEYQILSNLRTLHTYLKETQQ